MGDVTVFLTTESIAPRHPGAKGTAAPLENANGQLGWVGKRKSCSATRAGVGLPSTPTT
jgi:hypothetical protein